MRSSRLPGSALSASCFSTRSSMRRIVSHAPTRSPSTTTACGMSLRLGRPALEGEGGGEGWDASAAAAAALELALVTGVGAGSPCLAEASGAGAGGGGGGAGSPTPPISRMWRATFSLPRAT